MLIAFNKPYGVLSQFTPEPGSRWRTLADFGFPKGFYTLGRLDADSEGLILLSDEGGLNARLLDPAEAHRREYWVQVERVPASDALNRLSHGNLVVGDYRTRPCQARFLTESESSQIPPRNPPIRVRKSIADAWIALELTEGKNRQVRKMTAAVGHPTLRLFRVAIGDLRLASLALDPGQWKELRAEERILIWRK